MWGPDLYPSKVIRRQPISTLLYVLRRSRKTTSFYHYSGLGREFCTLLQVHLQ